MSNMQEARSHDSNPKSYKRWTDGETEKLKELVGNTNSTVREISKTLGRSYASVRSKLQTLGIKTGREGRREGGSQNWGSNLSDRHRKNFRKNEIRVGRLIRKLLGQGVEKIEISDLIGIPKDTLWGWVEIADLDLEE